MTVADKIAALKKFNRNASRFVLNELRNQEALIVDMNAEEQLFEHGMTNEGVKIDSYAPYASYTVEVKKAKGQPTDRVTLRDTGAFESSFKLIKKGHGFEIIATDEKADELAFQYGSDIFGLTDENMNEIKEQFIRPRIELELQKANE